VNQNRRLTVMIVAMAAVAVLALVIAMDRTIAPARALPNAPHAPLNAGCHARLNDGVIYPTIQGAVDASTDPSDVIKMAGYCSATNSYGGLSQVVYLSKTLTLRGGYTTTDWLVPDPAANPTTLDAEGNGRGIYIAGVISPTIEGVSITGGRPPGGNDDGGGVYVATATLTLSDSFVSSNQAYAGGGLSVVNGRATLISNTIAANDATRGCGGIFIDRSSTQITRNRIVTNSTEGDGGGLCIWDSTVSLDGNVIEGNSADLQWGGGIYMYGSDAVLARNIIKTNTVAYNGGGMAALESSVVLSDNVFQGNSAYNGGGLFLTSADATVSGNSVISNTATGEGGGASVGDSEVVFIGNLVSFNSAPIGGALSLIGGQITVDRDVVVSNTAAIGGGVFVGDGTGVFTNTVLASNRAGTEGAGLYVLDASVRLLHTTIARNQGGDGSGVYIASETLNSAVALTNTILVSHSIGLYAAAGTTAALNGTLWGSGTWANLIDYDGPGTILTGTVNIWGDPAFVAPDGGDYHIRSGSAAIDAGVNAGVITDIDGERRPFGRGYDLGADEFAIGVDWHHVYVPLALRGD
jgi:fibronectin-binding autotransporter adhesin